MVKMNCFEKASFYIIWSNTCLTEELIVGLSKHQCIGNVPIWDIAGVSKRNRSEKNTEKHTKNMQRQAFWTSNILSKKKPSKIGTEMCSIMLTCIKWLWSMSHVSFIKIATEQKMLCYTMGGWRNDMQTYICICANIIWLQAVQTPHIHRIPWAMKNNMTMSMILLHFHMNGFIQRWNLELPPKRHSEITCWSPTSCLQKIDCWRVVLHWAKAGREGRSWHPTPGRSPPPGSVMHMFPFFQPAINQNHMIIKQNVIPSEISIQHSHGLAKSWRHFGPGCRSTRCWVGSARVPMHQQQYPLGEFLQSGERLVPEFECHNNTLDKARTTLKTPVSPAPRLLHLVLAKITWGAKHRHVYFMTFYLQPSQSHSLLNSLEVRPQVPEKSYLRAAKIPERTSKVLVPTNKRYW